MKANNKKIYISGLLLVLLILSATITSAQTRATTNSTSTGTSSYSGATNLIVDYDNTNVDTDLQPGESGVLTITIKNVGGQPANNIDIWLPSLGDVFIDKRFTVGTMDSGESKSLQITIRVSSESTLGLHIIQARVTYDGYTASGVSDDNLGVVLEVPVKVYGNPAFQVKPQEATYYKDTIDNLELDIAIEDPVKDLEATISSSCFTVIGSTQKQLGDKTANQDFSLIYSIKPTQSGPCSATLRMEYRDQAGQDASSNISFGINIEDAGIDFKILNISYEPTGPGEKVAVKTVIKNVGKAEAEDVTLDLALTDPFTTADSSEKYVGTVGAGETIEETFNLAISWEAETSVYSVPLSISYKVGGSSYSVEKDIGIDVGGQVILEVIEVDSSGSSLKIDIANIGTRTAESVKGTLIVGGDAQVTSSSTGSSSSQTAGPGGNPLGMLTGGGRRPNTDTQTTGTNQAAQTPMGGTGNGTTTKQYISYKSDIKATKQTTFTFDTMISGTATLVLEYTGANNKRITQRIPITVGSASTSGISSRTMAARGGSTDTTTYLIYGAVALVVLFIGYKLYKKRKKN